MNNYDKNKKIINIQLDWFKISFDNKKIKDIQLQYFINQKEKGRKAHCNLLPNSYDFYKLCPLKIYESSIELNINDYNEEPIIKNKIVNYIPRFQLSICKSKEEKEKIKNLKSYDKKTETVDSADFTLNIDYRKKSLGKLRGDTRKNLYNLLN